MKLSSYCALGAIACLSLSFLLSMMFIFGNNELNSNQEFIAPQIHTLAVTIENSPVLSAFMGTCEFKKIDYYSGGTAFLVSRVKKENGVYLYRGITPYHVIDEITKALTTNVNASKRVQLSFPGWNSTPTELTVDVEPDWVVPTYDWASFTFESNIKIPCVQLANEQEYLAVTPTTDLYIAGNDDLEGTIIRKSVLASTTNRWPTESPGQQNQYGHEAPWCDYPEYFIRISMSLERGCSGGIVFLENGKVIGMVVAKASSSAAIALKAHTIVDAVKVNDKFFLVED